MIVAAMWGTMPSVHPNAATTLARDPRERPAASVYRTPVPGDTTTTSAVIRNSMLTVTSWARRRLAHGVAERSERSL